MSDPMNDSQLHLNVDDTPSKGLTGIPRPIHCPATQNKCEVGNDELDRIDIEHFLGTIAQVALAVAARSAAPSEDQERDD